MSTNRDQLKATASAVIDNGAINSVGKSEVLSCLQLHNEYKHT